jgi:dTDP-4-dehydrorhamnose 3,5-epimerase-like enzyme
MSRIEISNPGIKIQRLKNIGDVRGDLFKIQQGSLDFLSAIRDIHFGTIQPNAIRGNHYHVGKCEVLIISYSDQWKLVWSETDSAKTHEREFAGIGTVLIEIDEGIVHAIHNTGNLSLNIISLSNRSYNRKYPDTIKKILV